MRIRFNAVMMAVAVTGAALWLPVGLTLTG